MTSRDNKERKPFMRILMVENDLSRAEDFQSWVGEDDENVKLKLSLTGNIAMTIIDKDTPRTWNGFMLDYDLDEFSKEVAYKCGLHVARKIEEQADRDTPILIHSMNPAGATQMYEILKSAGFTSVTRIPFADMTKEKFLGWVNTCREVHYIWKEEWEDEWGEGNFFPMTVEEALKD